MIKKTIKLSAIIVMLSLPFALNGQKLIESVAGIVGNERILLSDIEGQVVQMKSSGNRMPIQELRCMIFEKAVEQKLFVDQARIDSIIVTPDQVEGRLNMSLNYYINQAGSEKVLEEAYKKSLIEIKNDLREVLIENQTIQQVQSSIAEGITVTPAEVKRYYNTSPKDSLVPAMVELSIIQIDAPQNEENTILARQRILDLRSEILGGKSFEIMARLYSDDGSAARGGEVGFKAKGGLLKEYADVAFTLKPNTISRVVETEAGFHIIQLIDRRDDLINTRHILIVPKLSTDDIIKATSTLDSIADLIRRDSVKFEDAARYASTHKESRTNGGKFVQEYEDTRRTLIPLEDLDPEMYQIVRNLKVGEISKAYRSTGENGKPVFRIIRLDNERPAHRANLKDDFELFQIEALYEKQNKKYTEWIEKKFEVTYIKVSEEFSQCNFTNKEWLK
jgi:peptidyl-prolyl cis-trans isomerase SurA